MNLFNYVKLMTVYGVAIYSIFKLGEVVDEYIEDVLDKD